MSKERFKQIGTTHLFLFKDGKILMSKRANTGWGDGKYSVVAGHIEENETAKEAIIREAKEEAGIDISELEVAHVMHRHEGDYRIDFFFTAKEWKSEPVNMEPEKCDDLSWFSLDELPENMLPYVKKALDCFLDKKFYSEHGWND